MIKRQKFTGKLTKLWRRPEQSLSEHTGTKVAEGKSIKKRPSDNINNNQSFEKKLAMRNEMENEEKTKRARYYVNMSI